MDVWDGAVSRKIALEKCNQSRRDVPYGSSNSNEKFVALKASKSGELSLDAALCSENNRPLSEVNQGLDHGSRLCNCVCFVRF